MAAGIVHSVPGSSVLSGALTLYGQLAERSAGAVGESSSWTCSATGATG